MKTQHSFSFRARYAEGFNNVTEWPWINSAGRWDNLADAVAAAGIWLKAQAAETVTQYCVEIIQIEELELVDHA